MTNGDMIRRYLSEMDDDELCRAATDLIQGNITNAEWEKLKAIAGDNIYSRMMLWLSQPSKEEEDPDSADAEWIPVSKSLPLLGVNVLVTRRMDNGVRYARIASYQGDCWMDNTDEYMKPNPHPVIAWKSMPMAYCGEE